VAKTIEQRPERAEATPPRAPRWWLRPLFLAATALLAAGIAASSIYAGSLYLYADSKLPHPGGPPPKYIGGPCVHHACNYLILGNDSRKGLTKGQQAYFGSGRTVKGQRSDTILLVRVDPRQERAVVLSFPRDLWVHIPGQGMGKVNSAYEGGPDRVAHVIQDLTGLHVNHFLSVNFVGFENVVRTLKGVPLCLDRPLYDKVAGLNLPAGCQKLDAFQALAFVRARHVCGDKIPDFSRITRQQQFLRAIMAKVLSVGMIFHAKSLIDQVAPNLLVDKDLNLADVIYLTTKLRGIKTGAVDFRSVPGDPYATVNTPAGTVDIVKLKPQAKVLFKRLREGLPLGTLGKTLTGTPPSPATISVRVYDDASGQVAPRAFRLLTKGGFDVRPTAPAGSLASRGPAILFRPGADQEAQVVHGYLRKLALREAPKGALTGDVAVIVDRSVPVPKTAPQPRTRGGAQKPPPACS
jgi:LCP family protein required for cell wall assembly